MNELERALDAGIIPWNSIEYRTRTYWVFNPTDPVCENHLIFAPVIRSMPGLIDCYQAAYQFGFQGHVANKWAKYRIVQNVSGKDTEYPYIELIPVYN